MGISLELLLFILLQLLHLKLLCKVKSCQDIAKNDYFAISLKNFQEENGVF